MKKTRWIFLLVFVLLTMLLAATIPAAAEAEEPSADELYQEQLEASGAQEIWDKLPEETRLLLDNLGITGLDKDSLSGLTPQASLSGLLGLLADQAGGPLRSAGILLGIILLCALMDGMIRLYSAYKESLEKKSMGFMMSEWDEKLLKYGHLFETKLMDLSVNIPLEEALDLGWGILAECFEPNETGLKTSLLQERWPKKDALN